MLQQLLQSFLLTLAFLLPLWLIYRILTNRSKGFSFNKELLLLLFFIYLVALASFTIIPVPDHESKFTPRHINLIPIAGSIKKFMLLYPSTLVDEKTDFWINLVGNILLFVPFGFLLPLLNKTTPIKTVLLTALIASLLIEVIQLISFAFEVYRYVDIDDVILNVGGAALGFWAYTTLPKKRITAAK